jgi:hypothetical protein
MRIHGSDTLSGEPRRFHRRTDDRRMQRPRQGMSLLTEVPRAAQYLEVTPRAGIQVTQLVEASNPTGEDLLAEVDPLAEVGPLAGVAMETDHQTLGKAASQKEAGPHNPRIMTETIPSMGRTPTRGGAAHHHHLDPEAGAVEVEEEEVSMTTVRVIPKERVRKAGATGAISSGQTWWIS